MRLNGINLCSLEETAWHPRLRVKLSEFSIWTQCTERSFESANEAAFRIPVKQPGPGYQVGLANSHVRLFRLRFWSLESELQKDKCYWSRLQMISKTVFARDEWLQLVTKWKPLRVQEIFRVIFKLKFLALNFKLFGVAFQVIKRWTWCKSFLRWSLVALCAFSRRWPS